MSTDSDISELLELNKALVKRIEKMRIRGSGQTQDEPEAYVGADAVMQHFGVSRATIHNWVHDSESPCPHQKRGKILRFKLSAVDAWYCGRLKGLRSVKP